MTLGIKLITDFWYMTKRWIGQNSHSSSEAYTNNWGLFGKEKYLAFDWWKHSLQILRRSEVSINFTRSLKKMQASQLLPLLYYIGFFPDASSPCDVKPKTCFIYTLRDNRSGNRDGIIIWTRGSHDPVIAHLVFNLTSKVHRKWGCYT
jgi:hypothetical protein